MALHCDPPLSKLTSIGVYHCSYIWNVEWNVATRGESRVLKMSLFKSNVLKEMSFKLFLGEKILKVNVIPMAPYVWFWGRIQVLDRDDIEPENICCLFSSTKVDAEFQFPLGDMGHTFTYEHRNYVPGTRFYRRGTENLTLLLELNISQNFDEHDDESFTKLILVPSINMKGTNTGIESPDLLLALSSDMQKLYTEKKVTDVNLKVKDRVFPVHKSILCARSPVFSSMLQSGMSESQNNIIDISDLDESSVEAMLLFLYSGAMKELQWESSLKLYYAGDKYQIESLKNKCRSFIQSHLSTSNTCEALLLADMHKDDDLMITVNNFIYHHRHEVFCSDAWKSFMTSQLRLAAEAMQYCFETEKNEKKLEK